MQKLNKNFDVIVIGGGAAGFFSAINIAEQQPTLSVVILEKSKTGLQKVKISGGGRCNVTHAEFIPSQLINNYPRGAKELLGPFHSFMTGDTMTWFEDRGVALNIEDDGRIFPSSNSSQTIIDCLLSEAKKHGVKTSYNQNVSDINVQAETDFKFKVQTQTHCFFSKILVVTTGSNPKFWQILKALGHKIVPPVPSLFTFNCKDNRITNIPGLVVKSVDVKVLGTSLSSRGPLLITHVGFSAPAILKLSAFGAFELALMQYHFQIEINFVQLDFDICLNQLKTFKTKYAKKTVSNTASFELPKRLWKTLVLASGIAHTQRWSETTYKQLNALCLQLTKAVFQISGKSTFKEEFVTAGGIDLKDINFKTFESKIIRKLFLAGEVLNIDAITGGFNFQNAWTGGYIIAKSIARA